MFPSSILRFGSLPSAKVNIILLTVINSTFRKIFNTRSQEVVGICLEMFNCLPAEKAIAIRKRNFLNKFCVTNNELCNVFTDHAKKELATLLEDI